MIRRNLSLVFLIIVSSLLISGYYNHNNYNKDEPVYSMLHDLKLEKNYIIKKRISMIENQEKYRVKEMKNFIVTAYTLNKECCGKDIDDVGYGITASGYDLKNKDLKEAKAIAVDPNIIPLGTKVKITFKDEKYKKYNGIYKAVDTGGSVVGNTIDLFIGDKEGAYEEAINFGRREAYVQIF